MSLLYFNLKSIESNFDQISDFNFSKLQLSLLQF